MTNQKEYDEEMFMLVIKYGDINAKFLEWYNNDITDNQDVSRCKCVCCGSGLQKVITGRADVMLIDGHIVEDSIRLESDFDSEIECNGDNSDGCELCARPDLFYDVMDFYNEQWKVRHEKEMEIKKE